jgi:hypothetical protein
MSFLQPMLLLALPLVSLPIIIHLINQRRYQTVRWGAMMFLLAANRMSRGYARLRQILIMAFRMAAIGTLVFAVSRPLAGGWLGLAAGGKPDTTIVLVDRSPSMRQEGAGAGGSKLETGRRQLVQTLETLGSSRWVLVEGASNRARELETVAALLASPGAEPTSASSDIPAMLLAARDYVRTNKAGRTEVWLCSDLRENDWNPESGRWPSLRDSFQELAQGVRFHLLAYPQAAPGNLSVRVTGVRRQETSRGAELILTILLVREGGADFKGTIPIQLEIDGARSEMTVEMVGARYELRDHRVPLERTHERGWGKVSIPADVNPADNDFWFVFDKPVPRRTVVVAEDAQAARPLQLASEISPDPAITCSAELVEPGALGSVEWDSVALLLWQAQLPTGDTAKLVRSFVERGGQLVFFPPREPTADEFYGVRWKSWVEDKGPVAVDTWRGDQDLLAHTQSGASLPVGELEVRRSCGMNGEVTALAGLRGGSTLLARATTTRGGVYFCATTPAVRDSSLASGGVVLYVMVQRALAAGAAALGNTRQLIAGELPAGEDPGRWKRLSGVEEAISTDYPLHRGVYQSDEKLIAVNRSQAEDGAPVLTDRRVADLFKGLDFARVNDRAGNISSLIQEVWRMFLTGMMIFLVGEAFLCLPKPPRPTPGTTP